GNSFGVIEPVDAEDELPVGETGVDIPSAAADFFGGGAAAEVVEIDADGKRAGDDFAALPVQSEAIGRGLDDGQSVDAAGALEEVSEIAVGLETDEIVFEEGLEDFVLLGEFGEN